MSEPLKNRVRDPLEGKTLEAILTELNDHFGWEELAKKLPVNCFKEDPSISSSLKFFRKTPWARTKLEKIYLAFVKSKTA